uniref:Uncharacterized protein n=1 Tax=Daucus carota subsp. sativus TaxID=79200 RepID=A0A175YJ67_DAUCS
MYSPPVSYLPESQFPTGSPGLQTENQDPDFWHADGWEEVAGVVAVAAVDTSLEVNPPKSSSSRNWKNDSRSLSEFMISSNPGAN